MTITDCETWGDPANVCHEDLPECDHDSHVANCALISEVELDNPNVTNYADNQVPANWSTMTLEERAEWLFTIYPGGLLNNGEVCWPEGSNGPGGVRGFTPTDNPINQALWAHIITYDETIIVCETAEAIQCALEAATEILWLLTGQQFGICTDCVEICPVPCTVDCCLGAYICLPCHPACDSDRGDVFYRGGRSYLQIADLQPGDEICYRYGHPAPKSVVFAVECLATEFLLKDCGSDKCQLPKNTQSINRQGVSATLIVDLANQFALGLTGITEIDRVIKAWNPHQLIRPPKVVDPCCTDNYIRRPRNKDLANA